MLMELKRDSSGIYKSNSYFFNEAIRFC